MAITLIEIFSLVLGRPRHRHHHCDPYVPARPIPDLSCNTILLSRDAPGKGLIMKVSGTFTAPTARKSGSPLALTDIDHFSLQRNGVEIATLAPSAATIAWNDTSPLTGSDKYDVFTITKDSFISDSSNDVLITIAAADPAAAIIDLAGTVSA